MTRRRPWLAATLLLASTLLSGCAVGPTYHRPAVALPAQWQESSTTHALWPSQDWWQGFGAPQLDAYTALCAASGRKVTECLVHLPVAGVLLCLTEHCVVDRRSQSGPRSNAPRRFEVFLHLLTQF